MRTKKPKMELVACATALLELDLSASVSSMEELIAEGYYHLNELRASANCNPALVNSFAHRIDCAEAILEQKKRSGL